MTKFICYVIYPPAVNWYEKYSVILTSSVITNLLLVMFYLFLQHSQSNLSSVNRIFNFMITLLILEASVISYDLYRFYYSRMKLKTVKQLFRYKVSSHTSDDAHNPNTVVSRIAVRGILTVSGMYSIVFLRDLFLPGE